MPPNYDLKHWDRRNLAHPDRLGHELVVGDRVAVPYGGGVIFGVVKTLRDNPWLVISTDEPGIDSPLARASFELLRFPKD